MTHTDCVLIIKEFLEKVYISVQKGFEECIIIMNEEIVGEWTVLKGDGNFGDIIEDFFYYVPIPHSNTTE